MVAVRSNVLLEHLAPWSFRPVLSHQSCNHSVFLWSQHAPGQWSKIKIRMGFFNKIHASDTHIEVELFQWPVVSLRYMLSGGCNVSFWSEQTTKPNSTNHTECDWLNLKHSFYALWHQWQLSKHTNPNKHSIILTAKQVNSFGTLFRSKEKIIQTYKGNNIGAMFKLNSSVNNSNFNFSLQKPWVLAKWKKCMLNKGKIKYEAGTSKANTGPTANRISRILQKVLTF